MIDSVGDAPTYTRKEFWTLTVTNTSVVLMALLSWFGIHIVMDANTLTAFAVVCSAIGQGIYIIRHKREKPLSQKPNEPIGANGTQEKQVEQVNQLGK